MELKSAETEVDDLRQLYERLQRHLLLNNNNSQQEHLVPKEGEQQWLPPLQNDEDEASTEEQRTASSSTHTPAESSNSDSAAQEGGASGNSTCSVSVASAAVTVDTSGTAAGAASAPAAPIPFSTARAAATAFDALQQRLEALQPRMGALKQRRHAKDPITGNPRYGANTLARIDRLSNQYQELVDGVANAVGEKEETNDNDTADRSGGTTTTESVAQSLRRQADAEDEAERRAVEQEVERQARNDERRKAEESLRLEHERQQREEAAQEADRARLELARQAQEARLAQQRARNEADNADREWERSIGKGVNAVREQLAILVDSTSNDATARKGAIEALHTIFSQIVARPEEPNFRRIRRDHPKFNADIGRHPGGKELLLAAGFVLGRIDDVPCYLSKEPNLETDMDGWASWYELLKASLEAIEEQLILTD